MFLVQAACQVDQLLRACTAVRGQKRTEVRELDNSVELVRETALKACVDLTLCLRGKAVCRGVHGTSLSASLCRVSKL